VQAPPGFFYDGPTFVAETAERLGPVFRRRLQSGAEVVYLVGPEANRLVLYTHRDHFSHEQGWTPVLGPYFGKGLLNMDGEEWGQHRKMMNPAFTAAYMATYLPVMRRVIAARTADWTARGTVELYAEARRITFDVAAATLVGLETGPEVDRLRDLFNVLLHPGYDPERESEAAFRERMAGVEGGLRDLLLPLIDARRRGRAGGGRAGDSDAPPQDVLGMLVRARDDAGQALSDEQLLAHVNILLVAGHETSTTLAAWMLYLLALHPAYLARVRAELDAVLEATGGEVTLEALRRMRLLHNAMTEAGRLQSPVRQAPRGVIKGFDIGGYHIPAGSQVRYCIAAGHRLGAIFPEPGRFDPDRFSDERAEDKRHPYALVTFGGGPRVCIGLNMAQVEVKTLAAHVLPAVEMEPEPGQTVRQAGIITGFPEPGIVVRVRPR
jgi:cytochrome P450